MLLRFFNIRVPPSLWEMGTRDGKVMSYLWTIMIDIYIIYIYIASMNCFKFEKRTIFEFVQQIVTWRQMVMTSFGCHQTATGNTSCHISKAFRLEFVLEEKSEKVKKTYNDQSFNFCSFCQIYQSCIIKGPSQYLISVSSSGTLNQPC